MKKEWNWRKMQGLHSMTDNDTNTSNHIHKSSFQRFVNVFWAQAFITFVAWISHMCCKWYTYTRVGSYIYGGRSRELDINIYRHPKKFIVSLPDSRRRVSARPKVHIWTQYQLQPQVVCHMCVFSCCQEIPHSIT